MAAAPTSRPTVEAWEARAAEWATWARTPGNDPFYELLNLPAFLTLLPPAGRLTVDVGCGEGRLGRTLAERGHKVVGVDSSPTLAGLARTAGGLHEVLDARADAIPLADASADLIVAFMTLQDMDEIEAPLDEAARVLGRGGVLCAAVPHPFAEMSRARPGDGDYFSAHRYADVIEHDGAAMTFESWRRPLSAYSGALERSGFRIESIREPIPNEAALRAVPRLAKWRTQAVFLHLRASLP